MAAAFDAGYGAEPFRGLCTEYPGDDIYPQADFRTEWGPVFHRGRLDGSARVILIGQDPAQHECVVRRCLVGEAGHRIQGFLARLGVDTHYVFVNTFLYGVYGKIASRYRHDPAIASYRNRWLDALATSPQIEAAVALGDLAHEAWTSWKRTPAGQGVQVAYAKIHHPTYPESSSRSTGTPKADAMRTMLRSWNAALQALRPAIVHPDVNRPLVLYGDVLQPADRVPIPAFDLPAGVPVWMGQAGAWATRLGTTAAKKRGNITITVPAGALP